MIYFDTVSKIEAMYGRSQSWTMFSFSLCLYFIYPRQSYATVEIHPYYNQFMLKYLIFMRFAF